MKTASQFLAIAEFFGDEMTDEQLAGLIDEARELSISDKEWLLSVLPGTSFYTEMSMHNGELWLYGCRWL